MGLQQKKRHLRLGVPEGIAVALVLLTCVSGIIWRWNSVDGRWRETAVTAFEVRVHEGDDSVDARLELRFTYVVDGVEYFGTYALGWIGRLFFGPLPDEALRMLVERGYERFSDLPVEIQQALQRKGIASFDYVPRPVLTEFEARGIPSPAELPEELKAAYRNQEYVKIAAAIDREFPDFTAYWIQSTQVASGEGGGYAESGFILQMLRRGFQLSVAYDSAAPGNFRVDIFRRWINVVALTLFLVGTLAAVLYSVFGYRRMKQIF